MGQTKVCPSCKTEKPLIDFHKNRSKKDGVASECKVCACERQRKIKPTKERKQYLSEYYKVWQEGNPGYKYQYQKENRAYLNSYLRDWRTNNKQRANGYRDSRRRNLKKLSNQSIFYREIIINDPCSFCGNPSEAIDHITPVINSGDNNWTNFTGICSSCNSRKKDRQMLQYMVSQISNQKEKIHD